MPIDPTQLLLTSPATRHPGSGTAAAPAAGVDFRDLIDPRDTATDRHKQSRSDKALKTARQLVSMILVQPILDQAQNDPMRVEMFHGGQAERIFQQRMDQVLAQRITEKSRMPIVDATYRSIMKWDTRRQAQSAPATKGTDLHG